MSWKFPCQHNVDIRVGGWQGRPHTILPYCKLQALCCDRWMESCVVRLCESLRELLCPQPGANSLKLFTSATVGGERRPSAGENVCESVSPLKSGRSLARAAPNPLPWHNFRKSVPATFKVVDFESSRTWKRSQILEAAAQQHPIHVQFWRWGSKMTRNLSNTYAGNENHSGRAWQVRFHGSWTALLQTELSNLSCPTPCHPLTTWNARSLEGLGSS